MAYTTGMLDQRVAVMNRESAETSPWGIDGKGIEWREEGEVWASVDWAKGKHALNAGAIDAYATVMIRMRWNRIVTPRSRVRHQGLTYQVIAETFHADKRANTIQFSAQQIVSDENSNE